MRFMIFFGLTMVAAFLVGVFTRDGDATRLTLMLGGLVAAGWLINIPADKDPLFGWMFEND